ncbi:MAG: hypothetical protein K2L72_02890, partial [Clostridia bacterium]|nr:hypothetical protein [Clostridia bacterium]
MVEFAADNGAMAVLQREQANEALGEIARKRVDLKWLAKFAVVPVIAAVMLFTGIFIPAKKATSNVPPSPPPIEGTEAQKTALRALIADVDASELETGLKGSVKEVLNGILTGLDTPMQESVRKAAVISSVKIIDSLIAASNSYVSVYTVFSGDAQLKGLATSIHEGVSFYKNGGVVINTLDGVKAKYKEADAVISGTLGSWTNSFLETLTTQSGEGVDPVPKPVNEASVTVKATSAALKAGLSGVVRPRTEDEASDGLFEALTVLANGLDGIKTSGVSAVGYYSNVSGYCENFTTEATKSLTVQSYRCMMDEFIRNSLAKIFKLTQSEIGNNELVVPDNPDNPVVTPKPPAPPGNDIKYGSDDLVLDVDTGEQVTYGQLIDSYYNKVNELILSGACSDEVAAYIRQYFQKLYGTGENN